MKTKYYLSALLILLSGWGITARAASSVLVWPIFQTISSTDKGSELWLQNRGNSAVTLQLRIFKWQQHHSATVYSDQKAVLASPPFVTVQPGQRQLIRLIRLQPTAAQHEDAYRIVIDEIPGSAASQTNSNNAGLIMRMRYVLPLFLYGQGIAPVSQDGPVSAIQHSLSWKVVSEKGQSLLAIANHGAMHARLSDIFWGSDAQHPAAYVSKGFLGYVLPGQTVLFPLTAHQTPGNLLFSRLADNVAPVGIAADR